MKGKKILVTGGAGFIGSHLCNHLLREGAEVLAVDNLFVGREELVPEGAEFKRVDICSPKIRDVIAEFYPDIVVHLAAIHYIPYCNAHPEETFEVNVMGIRNVVEAAGDRLFLFASSAAVYPVSDEPLKEDVRPGPMDIYGKTKLVGEDIVKLMNKDAIIARIFNVYGPNDTNPHVIPEIISRVKSGKRKIELGNLTPKRDYIDVDDVCRALIALLKNGEGGVYNVGTGREHSVKKVVKIVSEILGEEIESKQDKSRMRKVDREHLLADISKLRGIGWKPKVRFEDGLRKLIWL